jgi:hypothetical protein
MHKNIKKTTLPQINSRITNGPCEKTYLLSKISLLIFLVKDKAVILIHSKFIQLSFVNY